MPTLTSRILAAVIILVIFVIIVGGFLAFRERAPTTTPTITITETKTMPTTPTLTETITPKTETPTLQILEIGTSRIRVPGDFYDFVIKAKRGEITVNINFWTAMLPFEVNVVNKVVQMFMAEYPGIKIRYTGTVANMKEAVKAGIVAGDVENTAHVFTWAHDWTGEMADGGFIVSLSKYLPPETIEDLRKEYAAYAFASGTYKLEVYGLPWSAEAVALICNLDMTNNVTPNTFSQLEDLMKKWYDPGKGTYGIAWQIDPYHIYPLVTAFGGFYYDEDKDIVGANSVGTVEGFKFLFSKVLPYMFTKDLSHEAQLSIFEEGKAPCIVTGPWNIPRIKEKIARIAVAPIPEIDGKTPKPFSGVKLLWVTRAAEVDKNRLYASILFTLWFTLKDDALKTLTDEAGYIPVKLSMIDYIKANKEKYPIVMGFSLSLGNSIPMPKSLKMAKVWGPIAEALSSLTTIYNEKGLKEAVDSIKMSLDEAQNKILEAFKR